MNTKKYNNFMCNYDGFKGSRTLQVVLDQVPAELQYALTGKQLAKVASAINKAYHTGRSSCGAEIVDGDAIWIDKLGKLIDLDKIAKI